MPVDTNPDDVSFDLDVPIGPDEAAKLLDGLEVVVVPRGRPLTDTGYRPCRRGTWISEIGITYNIEDSHYSTIHIVPTPRARGVWGILNPDLSESARATYEEVIACLILLRFTATVLSWDAIYQQIACHITYNIEDSHYSTIHIVPTPRARGVWGILNPDLSESARATYEEVIACLILLRFTATVLSWDAIYQQIACGMAACGRWPDLGR